MKAAVVEAFDRAPRYTEFADPVAGDGEVLVKVSAAGLHQIVRALANGTHYGSAGILPFVPGVDGVGRLPDGKRVFFGATRPPYGTFAELSITQPWMCVPVPDGLDDVTAAALANPGMSSKAALMRGEFVAGESVLILGATGVSGRMAVQIARRLGTEKIVAVGRSPKALAELSALGADTAISLEQEPAALVEALRAAIAEAKVNVVLDYLWGQPAELLLQAIAQKGLSHAAPRIRYVQIGSMAGANISLPAATLRSSGLELLGSGFGSASLEQILKAVRELFEEAAKKPFVNATKAVSLREVEAVWNSPGQGTRLVFQP
ncbi:MAG TPA: zinc-binding alcohol dehydrogenase family protein [Acidobacteriaceae bacterium]|nr:zinc-binding alcohol dehydrogenase family protein [Acidobacteriaceae bacterium]